MSGKTESQVELISLCRPYSGKRVCVTGAAGFIGSHLTACLLAGGAQVVAIDDLSTGSRDVLDRLQSYYSPERLQVIIANVNDRELLSDVLGKDVFSVFHQAALGSVPRSFDDPYASASANVQGSIALYHLVVKRKIPHFVFASSSSVYGNSQQLRKVEGEEGEVLSPYALTKKWIEEFIALFAHYSGTSAVGLRYFNVFGPGQSPAGPYAAVVPRWLQAAALGKPCEIFGDGETSRDFCFIDNVVAANLVAGQCRLASGVVELCNVSGGEEVSLNALHALLAQVLREERPDLELHPPNFTAFRIGDVRRSLADLQRAKRLLQYRPLVSFQQGLQETVRHFFRDGTLSYWGIN